MPEWCLTIFICAIGCTVSCSSSNVTAPSCPSPAAHPSGVRPSIPRELGSISSRSSSTLITPSCPSIAAHKSGVLLTQSRWLIPQPAASINVVTSSTHPKNDAQCSLENSGEVLVPPIYLGCSTCLKSDAADTWSLYRPKSSSARVRAWSESSRFACVPQYLEEYARN